jgi:FlaG/FlaF family flagellin (archaellin)
MAAAVYDILIEQGATFQLHVVYKDSSENPIDLSGYTARMQVRQKYSDPDALLTLTTENGGISLGGVTGTIDVTSSATDTAELTTKCGVYDLELQNAAGIVTRLIEGNVTITPEVTRTELL